MNSLGKWEGVGPWKSRVFWAPNRNPYQLDAISQDQNNSRFSGPNPLPIAHVMDLHASKTLHTGPYKSKVHK
jgi:hypothetical protein